MIKEFSNLGGITQKFREMTGEMIGGKPEFDEFFLTYYPAKMFFYKDERILYQIREMSDSPYASIIVPGYVMSEPYTKNGEEFFDFGYRIGDEKVIKKDSTAVKVESIKEEDKKELTEIIKRITKKECKIDKKYKIDFW